MRTISILGATGSIGTQALDIVRRHPDRFSAKGLAAGRNAEALFAAAREFGSSYLGLVEKPEEIPADLRNRHWFFGPDSAEQVAEAAAADDALLAIVGIDGLKGALKAIDSSKRILLANKEALVTGGHLVTGRAKERNVKILPVDSEHSAIFQCLEAANGNPVKRLILTASGGALRDRSAQDMENASVEDVLRHPNWAMGRKITVDCATMLNKGLEVIEASYLFAMPENRIDVVIHPQSVIHSMAEFEDGAVLAQLGKPDMRGPIGYAMGYPDRIPYDAERLDFSKLSGLTFAEPDLEKYPAFALARQAFRDGGSKPVTLNGANEEAVAAFLAREIPFGAIARSLEYALNKSASGSVHTVSDVYLIDAEARGYAKEYLKEFRRKKC